VAAGRGGIVKKLGTSDSCSCLSKLANIKSIAEPRSIPRVIWRSRHACILQWEASLQPGQILDGPLRAALPETQSVAASSPIYSVAARRFHWWTAALVAAQIPLGLYMANRGNELNISARTLDSLFTTHELLGLTIFVFVVTRLWYRLSHGKPPDESTIEPWQKVVSHLNHWGLYVLLIGVPVGGVIGVMLYPASDLYGFHLRALATPTALQAAIS
jgi:cytochrome b561